MSQTVSADPQHLADYASALHDTEWFAHAHGDPLQDALDAFVRGCPEHGFTPDITGDDVRAHTERGAALAVWTAAVGHAVATADEFQPPLVGWIGGAPRTVRVDDVEGHLLALGAFPIPEQAQSWEAGLAIGQAVESAIQAGDADGAEAILRSLADLEDNEIALTAALMALGDLDAIEDRITDLRPKGNPFGRFFGGAWDSVTGTASTAWNLTGRLVHDPGGFADAWGDLGTGLWWGVRNPDDFALAIVDWEGLQDDPVRWLGGLAPDAIAAVATGGTAAAASRGTSATRATLRAVRSADNLRDLMRGLRALPDSLTVDVTQRVRTIGGRQVTWTPIGAVDQAGNAARVSIGTGRGPLARLTSGFGYDPTTTFRGAQYVTRRTDQPLTLYRAGNDGAPLGQYWTTIEPSGPLQGQWDSALVPAWGNQADHVTEIRVPSGQTIYEGFAAPQATYTPAPGLGTLQGGSPQVLLNNVPEGWITDVHPVGP